MNITHYILFVFIFVVKIIVYLDFFSVLMKKREIGKLKKSILVFCVFVCLLIIERYVLTGFRIFPAMFSFFVMNMFLYDGEMRERIRLNLIVFAVTIFSRFILLFITRAIVDENLIAVSYLVNETFALILAVEMLRFLILRGIRDFTILKRDRMENAENKKAKNRKQTIPISWVILLPASTLLVYCEIIGLRNNQNSRAQLEVLLMVGSAGILVSNVLYMYILKKMLESQQSRIEAETELAQNRFETAYYNVIEEKNIANSHVIHNMKHYIQTINHLIGEGHVDMAEKTACELQNVLDENKGPEFCMDRILNALISEKINRANESGIKIETEIEPGLNLEFMNVLDIIAIFGNLIENAIEAADKCSKKKICIRIFENESGSHIVFTIINSFEEGTYISGNIYKTTKTEPKGHGIGIKNVEATLKKYNGLMKVTAEEGIFTVTGIIAV